ncbi:MAG: 6-bladed beta-propeller [Lewinellaceae bacterium]|nr:6-bladed beta-propeller [Saprospiraceae bacterium]MCB9341259.1 6-bladed beta-propeller [Lewinellaceae bacterium]
MSERRKFIEQSLAALTGTVLFPFGGNGMSGYFEKYKDIILGHNNFQYKIDLNWGALNHEFYPVNDCHEMVQDSQGRIVLLTNHTKNNVIIYDKSGQLLEVWGTDFPGAHGLTLHVENGEDFLYITDYERHEVIKTTIDGKVVLVLPYPAETGQYEKADQYKPTETAIAPNGDIFVADGYGEQFILHYNSKGELLHFFGGKGDDDTSLDNAHGIVVDRREAGNQTLLITDRKRNQFKRFRMDGKLLEVFNLPGAYVCRPVIHGEHIYTATIWSGDGQPETGFVSILDKNNRIVSAPGGIEPVYENGQLRRMQQAIKIFKHPHDVCVDEDENLYVAQWNSGKTYPVKLVRV